VNNAEFLQHGGRGSVSVMDVKKMLRPEFDDTESRRRANYDSGTWSGRPAGPSRAADREPLGKLLTEAARTASASSAGRTGGRRGQIEMALGHPGHACPAFPCLSSRDSAPGGSFATPDPDSLAAGPNPEFLALGHGSRRKTNLFWEGGHQLRVSDGSAAALMGIPVVEVAPAHSSADRPLTASGKPERQIHRRDRAKSGQAGLRRHSIVDHRRGSRRTARRRRGGSRAGRTDDPNGQTRPFTSPGTPDGRQIIGRDLPHEQCAIVDLRKALAHDPARKSRAFRSPARQTQMGDPPRPPEGHRGHVGGRYAVVSGGRASLPTLRRVGTVWVIDLHQRASSGRDGCRQ